MLDFARDFAHELELILVESGFWLLLGFALAGVARALIPTRFVRKHLGGRGMWGVLKGALIGVPTPACSCAVIPLASSIRKQGASKGSSAAFAISTPETGADTIAYTWGLIGPVLAIARPIGAFLAGALAGALINVLDRTFSPGDGPVEAAANPPGDASPGAAAGACAGPHCSCAEADPDDQPAVARQTLPRRALEALRYGFVELPMDIGWWLIAGLLATALIGALVPATWIEQHLGGGLGPMLLMLAAGLPMYVCATASTPVVAMLIAKGLSPGAALVFLLAGPATNLATMSWVIKDLGFRALWVYLASIAAVSLALGLAVDALWPTAGAAAAATLANGAHHEEGPLRLALGLIAGAILLIGAGLRLASVLRARASTRSDKPSARVQSCCD